MNKNNHKAMLNKHQKIVIGLWLGPIIAMVLILVFYAVLALSGLASGNGMSTAKAILAILGALSVMVFFAGIFLSIVFILKGDDVGDSRFKMKEAIRFGWETVKRKFWFFFGAIIITVIVQFLPVIYSLISNSVLGRNPQDFYGDSAIISIIFWIIGMVIGIGWIKIALKLAQNEEAEFSDLFSGWKFFFKYLFGSILYFLIVIAGTVLFIIPGIIWQVKFMFFPYLILEGNGPVEALKKSGAITQGAKWDLFFFTFLLGMINLLGAALLFIGMFWTMPLITIAMASVYVKLKAQVKA